MSWPIGSDIYLLQNQLLLAPILIVLFIGSYQKQWLPLFVIFIIYSILYINQKQQIFLHIKNVNSEFPIGT